MKLSSIRVLALVGGLAGVGGCGGTDGDAAKPAPVVEKPAPEPIKKPTVEPDVKDMKPADARPPETKPAAKTVDELPPLLPPSGAKDERSDTPPK